MVLNETMHLRPTQNLARIFRDRIESGQWPVGTRLPTTRELSNEFGVSVNTVQGAFRDLQAEDLVERAPRRGGFVKARPHSAGAAATLAVKQIAIVAEAVSQDQPRDSDNWGYRIARAAERELARAGLQATLISWDVGEADAHQRLQARVQQVRDRIAGAICFPSPALPAMVEQFREARTPYVTINRPDKRATENFVVADNADGGRRIGTCFARMGLDRVLVLADNLIPGNSSMEKFAGFLEGYIVAGMPSRNVDFVVCNGSYFGDGYRTMQAHATQFGPPRGVFTTGDHLALGAIQFCRDQGLDVPGNIGIASSTGLDVAAYCYPSLTVIEQPMDQLGASAAQMLLAMISDGTCRAAGLYVPSRLVIRQSLPVAAPVAEEVGAVLAPDERERSEAERRNRPAHS